VYASKIHFNIFQTLINNQKILDINPTLSLIFSSSNKIQFLLFYMITERLRASSSNTPSSSTAVSFNFYTIDIMTRNTKPIPK
jgi:uncharacterized pyridoxamine 5'-phosphate oxidase family protein